MDLWADDSLNFQMRIRTNDSVNCMNSEEFSYDIGDISVLMSNDCKFDIEDSSYQDKEIIKNIDHVIIERDNICCGAIVTSTDDAFNRDYCRRTNKEAQIANIVFSQYKCARCGSIKLKCNICGGFPHIDDIHGYSIPLYHFAYCMKKTDVKYDIITSDGEHHGMYIKDWAAKNPHLIITEPLLEGHSCISCGMFYESPPSYELVLKHISKCIGSSYIPRRRVKNLNMQ